MKLYSQYKQKIEKLGKIKTAYFTSFNIDVEFIEKYILAPLFHEDIPDNKFSIEDLNLELMKEKIDLKFFYDANMLLSNEKKTLIDLHPILLRNGFFHPKVIYLEGENGAYLFVGSGNLTMSGWGRNIEAFNIIKVSNTNLKKQVLDFFDAVFILANLNPTRKTSRKPSFNNNIDFVYSFEESSDSFFLDTLSLQRTLQIYSPYFSNNLKELFENFQFKSLTEINIIPDLIENSKMRIKELPDDPRVYFYENIKPDGIKINHSKVWLSDTKYAIGSYNCTVAALFGKNFEAAIVENFEDYGELDITNENRFKPQLVEKNEELNDILEVKRYKAVYSLTFNYITREIYLEEVTNENFKKIQIVLPSFEKSISLKELERLKAIDRERLFSSIIKNKKFSILDKKNNLIFEGFVTEFKAKQDNRCSIQAESLEDVFLSFQDVKNPTEAKMLLSRSFDFDNDADKTFTKKQPQNNINYFSMFNGFLNLNNKLDMLLEKNINEYELNKFCFYSASSLSVMINIIKKELEPSTLFLYLTIKELNALIKRVNPYLKDTQKFQSLKINIELKTEDKKFIKGFYAN